MRKKILTACMAIVALAAFAAPSASATNLKENGTTLAVGSSVKSTNVGSILFTAGELTTSCNLFVGNWTITSESGGTIVIEMGSTIGTYGGTGKGGDCTSPLGDVKWSTHSRTCLHINNSDSVTITGCGASHLFVLNITGIVTCNYRAASIGGTISTSGDAAVTITEQPVTEEGGKFLCPDSGKLDMSFALTTTDGTTLQFTS